MLLIDGTERVRGASQIFLHQEPFWLPVEPFAALVYIAVGTVTTDRPVVPPWGNLETLKYSVKQLRTVLPADGIDFIPARYLGYPGHGYRLNLSPAEIGWNHTTLSRHSDHRVRQVFAGEPPALTAFA